MSVTSHLHAFFISELFGSLRLDFLIRELFQSFRNHTLCIAFAIDPKALIFLILLNNLKLKLIGDMVMVFLWTKGILNYIICFYLIYLLSKISRNTTYRVSQLYGNRHK